MMTMKTTAQIATDDAARVLRAAYDAAHATGPAGGLWTTPACEAAIHEAETRFARALGGETEEALVRVAARGPWLTFDAREAQARDDVRSRVVASGLVAESLVPFSYSLVVAA
jgi:hypothetical protein